MSTIINPGGGGGATPSTGGAASVTTAGIGGFFGVIEDIEANTSATLGGTAGSLTANNTVRGIEFTLKAQYKVTKIVFTCSNPGGTSVAPVMDVGIMSADLSTLLLHSGAIDISTTAETTYSTTITPVTLNPGTYVFVWTGNATSGITNISYSGVIMAGGKLSPIMNKNATRFWSKANAATAGVLPGSISAPAAALDTTAYAPLTWFEP